MRNHILLIISTGNDFLRKTSETKIVDNWNSRTFCSYGFSIKSAHWLPGDKTGVKYGFFPIFSKLSHPIIPIFDQSYRQKQDTPFFMIHYFNNEKTTNKWIIYHQRIYGKYGIKNEAISNVKKKYLIKINIPCGIYMRDDKFTTDSGIVNLHPTKGTHWLCLLTKFILIHMAVHPQLRYLITF